jgi:hypothetical protein
MSKGRIAVFGAAVLGVCLVWAAPASASSALVVTPNTNLVDFQAVTVDGSGFPANTQLAVAECIVGATNPQTDCDLSFFQLVASDGTGAYSTQFTVERLINTSAGQVDCAPSNCALFSSDLNFGSPASAPLEFNPDVPPQPRLKLSLTVDPRGTVVAKTGQVTVHGTVSCNLAADVSILVGIQQRAGRVLIQGSAFTELPCDGTTAWSATGSGSNGIFKGGSAQLDTTAFGSAGPQFVSTEVVTNVRLTGSA